MVSMDSVAVTLEYIVYPVMVLSPGSFQVSVTVLEVDVAVRFEGADGGELAGCVGCAGYEPAVETETRLETAEVPLLLTDAMPNS